MHIWDTKRIALHLDGLQCDTYFFGGSQNEN